MSQHERTAWWSLGSGILIWMFLLMRFTEAGRIVDLPAGYALSTYVQMIVLWICASVVPAVLAARRPQQSGKDERDRAIDALRTAPQERFALPIRRKRRGLCPSCGARPQGPYPVRYSDAAGDVP